MVSYYAGAAIMPRHILPGSLFIRGALNNAILAFSEHKKTKMSFLSPVYFFLAPQGTSDLFRGSLVVF